MKKILGIFVIMIMFCIGINGINAKEVKPNTFFLDVTIPGSKIPELICNPIDGTNVNLGTSITCTSSSPGVTLSCYGAGANTSGVQSSITCSATTTGQITFSASGSGYTTDYAYFSAADTSNSNVDPTPYNSCQDFKDLTHTAWFIIRVAAPVMLLLFGSLDFGRATMAADEKEMQKAINNFIKRLIIAIAIFLLPTIVDLIVGLTQFGDLTSCL